MMVELLWWIFAAMAFGGGLGMVANRSPVGSLLSLVLTLFSLGVLFILMGAHFIGVVQVIVYAGAIMVLFLFVIMLLNLGHEYRPDFRSLAWIAAASAGAGIMGWLVVRPFLELSPLDLAVGEPAAVAVAEHGAVGAVGFPLFQEYVVAFEVVSLLLLAAVIGATLLAKRRI